MTFDITEYSLNKTNEIIKNMEGESFHNHYHILYDYDLLSKTNVPHFLSSNEFVLRKRIA